MVSRVNGVCLSHSPVLPLGGAQLAVSHKLNYYPANCIFIFNREIWDVLSIASTHLNVQYYSSCQVYSFLKNSPVCSDWSALTGLSINPPPPSPPCAVFLVSECLRAATVYLSHHDPRGAKFGWLSALFKVQFLNMDCMHLCGLSIMMSYYL